MSRIARIVVEGVPYHITQRGNGRQQVFFDAADYQLYLDLLQRSATDADLVIWGWCLMPNHVHVVAVPHRPHAMASALGRTHADYAPPPQSAQAGLWPRLAGALLLLPCRGRAPLASPGVRRAQSRPGAHGGAGRALPLVERPSAFG